MCVPSRLVLWAPQLRHEIAHIDPQNLGDLEDLDEVEPPLPAFVLGDERLRPPESLGELDLSQALGLPAGDQPVAQPSIGRTEEDRVTAGSKRQIASSSMAPSTTLFRQPVGWRGNRSPARFRDGKSLRRTAGRSGSTAAPMELSTRSMICGANSTNAKW